MLIGYYYGPNGSADIAPLFLGAFKVLLALFLLEMGLCASKHLYPLPLKHCPAAIRTAIKDADVGIAIFASLGITFPFNVLVGIPLYYKMLSWMAL